MTFAHWMVGGAVLLPLAAWIFFWQAKLKAKASLRWPTADGVITRSEIEHRVERDADDRLRDAYWVSVAYDYSVQGEALTSNKVAFMFNSSFGSHSAAAAKLAPYGVGARVSVRYNPEKPEEAVLETATPQLLFPIIVTAVGAVFAFVGTMILMFGGGPPAP